MLAKFQRVNGFGTLGLDPMSDPKWSLDFKTKKVDEFLHVFWRSKRCHCFIDEAGKSVGQFDSVMQETATEGRHWGHSCYFISQRGVQIARTVRDQCSHLFLFNTSLEDSKTHANEWNQPELKTAYTLPQGTYFYATRFGKLQRNVLFTPRGVDHDRTPDNVIRRGDHSAGTLDAESSVAESDDETPSARDSVAAD